MKIALLLITAGFAGASTCNECLPSFTGYSFHYDTLAPNGVDLVIHENELDLVNYFCFQPPAYETPPPPPPPVINVLPNPPGPPPIEPSPNEATTPEPTAWSMVLGGLALLALGMFRNRRPKLYQVGGRGIVLASKKPIAPQPWMKHRRVTIGATIHPMHPESENAIAVEEPLL